MASPRWRKVFRDLWGHKFRTLLVVLSIAVGIFSIVVVLGARGVLLREFEVVFEHSNAPIATILVDRADERVITAVAEVDGVREAEGRRSVFLRFEEGLAPRDMPATGWDTVRAIAVPDFHNQRVGRFTPVDTRSWPPGRGEIVLEQSASAIGEFKIGDTLTVQNAAGKRATLRVAGFTHDINAFPAHFVGMATGFISMETLAMLDEPRDYNTITFVADDPDITRAEALALTEHISEAVIEDRGLRVLQTQVPEPGSHFLGDIFKAVSLLLLALGVLSMLLSGFLVVTTMQALISQQVRQVGIMKAIGGKTQQIMGMYTGMVLIYGVMAVAIGVPVGIAAAQWFSDFGAGMLNFRITSYMPPLWVVGLGVLIGLAIPFLGAIMPITSGTRMPVVRALNATGLSRTNFGHGLVDRVLGLVRGLPRPIALSLRNTFLRKGRLALTLTTLILAAAVLMSVLTVQRSILATVDTVDIWRSDAQFQLALTQPADRVLSIARQGRGVAMAEGALDRRATLLREDGSKSDAINVIGLTPETAFVSPVIEQGRWLESTDTYSIVVNSDVLDDLPEFSLGRVVELDIRGVERKWKVVGVVSSGLMGPVIYAPYDQLDTVLRGNGGINRVLVRTEFSHATAQEQAARDLERRFEQSDVAVLSMQTQIEARDTVAEQLGILVMFLAIMAAILALVGVIGLTGTMTINVLESQREIGVMRAIGACHRSIYSIFITESLVVALMAWFVGALLSWPMSVALTDMLSDAMGLPLVYAYSWSGVGITLLAMTAVALAASLLPSYRASQVSVRDSIAWE